MFPHAMNFAAFRCLAAVVTAVLCAASSSAAQALKNERHLLARRLTLRAELLEACLAADPATRRVATELCNDISRRNPVVPLVHAVFALRELEFDAAATFRAGLVAYVVPEVVDLDRFHQVHVTLRQNHRVELSGDVRVLCTLRDGAGSALRDAVYRGTPTIDDFLRASVRASIPITDLADGRYSIEILPIVGGDAPAGRAPGLVLPVRVSRNYEQRALKHPLGFTPFHERYTARNSEIATMLEALEDKVETRDARALWRGALRRVNRAFRGEPRLPGVDSLHDLDRLDRIVADLDAGRDPLEAYRGAGRRTIGISVADAAADRRPLLETEIVQVSIDLPKLDGARAPVTKPLVVVMPGQPTWDGLADRPTSKWVEQPEWLAKSLHRVGFDSAQAVHLAILESPGKLKSPTQVLVAATRKLLELLPVQTDRVVWVGERDGAYCVSRALLLAPGLASRAVLINGGMFSNAELDGFGPGVGGGKGVELLLVCSKGHPSESTLRGVVGRSVGRCSARWVLGEATRPWPVALALAANEVQAFALQD